MATKTTMMMVMIMRSGNVGEAGEEDKDDEADGEDEEDDDSVQTAASRCEELLEAMHLLREADVDLLTIGQYLAPSPQHLPIDRFPEPEMFSLWDQEARQMGFKAVASGPLVRSSYRGGLLYEEAKGAENITTYGDSETL